MKKTYIRPETTIFQMRTHQTIMNTSTVIVREKEYNEEMTDLSRRSDSLWDDDDEETVY
jgi:hypothetical protein